MGVPSSSPAVDGWSGSVAAAPAVRPGLSDQSGVEQQMVAVRERRRHLGEERRAAQMKSRVSPGPPLAMLFSEPRCWKPAKRHMTLEEPGGCRLINGQN